MIENAVFTLSVAILNDIMLKQDLCLEIFFVGNVEQDVLSYYHTFVIQVPRVITETKRQCTKQIKNLLIACLTL